MLPLHLTLVNVKNRMRKAWAGVPDEQITEYVLVGSALPSCCLNKPSQIARNIGTKHQIIW
jgi:hypothetical protein